MSNTRTSEPFNPAILSSEKKGRPPAVRRGRGFHVWYVIFHAANAGALALLLTGHPWLALAVALLPAPWYAYIKVHAASRAFGPVVTRFRTDRREVWLTIDDGPDPSSTPTLLAQLERHGVKATFFLIGQKVRQHPQLVAEILRRGHTIGNHTQTHPCTWFWCATSRQTAAEVDACEASLHAAGAPRAKLFRSPAGIKNLGLHAQLASRGLDFVLWSARGFDTTQREIPRVIARIAGKLRPGAIILIHENPADPERQNALVESLLARLRDEGYSCVIPSGDALVR